MRVQNLHEHDVIFKNERDKSRNRDSKGNYIEKKFVHQKRKLDIYIYIYLKKMKRSKDDKSIRLMILTSQVLHDEMNRKQIIVIELIEVEQIENDKIYEVAVTISTTWRCQTRRFVRREWDIYKNVFSMECEKRRNS